MAEISGKLRKSVIGSAPICHWCGFTGHASGFEADHVIPFSLGGHTTIDNLVAACTPCNRSRGNASPRDAKRWIARSRFLQLTKEEKFANALEVMNAVLVRS